MQICSTRNVTEASLSFVQTNLNPHVEKAAKGIHLFPNMYRPQIVFCKVTITALVNQAHKRFIRTWWSVQTMLKRAYVREMLLWGPYTGQSCRLNSSAAVWIGMCHAAGGMPVKSVGNLLLSNRPGARAHSNLFNFCLFFT